ncbi:MAG: hypothetical protein GDA48_05855 [Hormoscilla sp. GM102CHS1]|nr:hypothetical protein [Hormoscilla sp. GM102CHS1]
MTSPELYKGWLIEARQVFCVQVWSAGGGDCAIPVHNAQNESEALALAKRWIDMQTEPAESHHPSDSSEEHDPFPLDWDDDDIPF